MFILFNCLIFASWVNHRKICILIHTFIGLGNDAPTAQCSAGYYCPGGQDTATPSDLLCWKGHYCLQGSVASTICPNGTYQFNEGKDNCDICPAGYYCDAISGERSKFANLFILLIYQVRGQILQFFSFCKFKELEISCIVVFYLLIIKFSFNMIISIPEIPAAIIWLQTIYSISSLKY